MNSSAAPFRSAVPQLPSGLPRLQRGSHLVPEDGACVMEYVSVLVGDTFGDHPRCTDPTVAAVARLVNDASTDTGRQRLTILAPALAATPPTGPTRVPDIVEAALRAASESTRNRAGLRPHLRTTARRRESLAGTGLRAGLARRLDPVYRRGAARRALEASVAAVRSLPPDQRDRALVTILTAALAAAAPSPGERPVPGGDPARRHDPDARWVPLLTAGPTR